jgi:hypothetical protein
MGSLIENQMKYISCFFSVFTLLISSACAQDYHAVQGSSYAGSLGVSNNPASITSTPYTWDIDILSMQLKTTSNAYTVNDYSLISSAKNSTASINNGNYERYADLNFNINLLNVRFSLNRWQAIAFGINLRGNGRAKTNVYNYNDTLQDINQFFGNNQNNQVLQGSFSSSSWVEIFATYSQTLWDDNQGRLNGGITVKSTRGISGAFAQLSNVTTLQTPNSQDTSYTLQTGSARYGYSYNYDGWQNNNSTTQNLKDFMTNSRGGFSVDLGFEYLIKPQGVVIGSDADNYYDYDWKIGVSLLDWGYNQYKYGSKSRAFASPANNITGEIINQKFDSLTNFNEFNDSLATIVNGFSTINGKFKVENPTRLVINIDKPLQNDFYINAEVSLNLHNELIGTSRFYTQQLNLLTVTPRWETRKWGIYLPIQYNIERNFWVGGAFKAGPLLLGIHNWAYIFSKNKIQNGGGYLALIIRSPKNNHAKTDKRLDCPK